MRLTAHQDHATLIVKPENQAIRIEGTSQVGCGTATTLNTDTVLILDESDNFATPAGNDGDTTVQIFKPHRFAPGKTDEPFPNEDEIEFLVDTKGGNDLLRAGGSDVDDSYDLTVGNDGLSWNTDLDADIVGMPFDMVALAGGRSTDWFSGQGGRGTGAPLTTAKVFQVCEQRQPGPDQGQRHRRRRHAGRRLGQRHDRRRRRQRHDLGQHRRGHAVRRCGHRRGQLRRLLAARDGRSRPHGRAGHRRRDRHAQRVRERHGQLVRRPPVGHDGRQRA